MFISITTPEAWQTPTFVDGVLDSLARRIPAPRLPGLKPNRYRIRQDAIDAAIKALGPHARPEFEFEIIRLDGMWLWKPTEQTRHVARGSFQAKMDGGSRRANHVGARTVKTTTVTLELPETEAIALSKLCRRINVEDLIRFAGDDGFGMDTAVFKLARALRAAGIRTE